MKSLSSLLKTTGRASRRAFARFGAVASVGLFIAGAFSGCAINYPVAVETITDANGVTTTRRLKAPTIAIWPATSTLEKQRASLGKTFSIGTEGLSEDGGGTNLIEALRALDSMVGKIAK